MRVGRTRLAVAAGAIALVTAVPVTPAHAQSDGCFLGSPNIVRDVTDCAFYVVESVNGCFIGSPNIIRDVTDCAAYVVDRLTV